MKSYRTKIIQWNFWSWNILKHSRSQILFLTHLFPCLHYNHISLKFSYFKTNSLIYLCCVSRKVALNSPLVPKFSSPWDWLLHLHEDSKIILFNQDKAQQATICVQFYDTVSFCVTCYYDLTLLCGCKSKIIFYYMKNNKKLLKMMNSEKILYINPILVSPKVVLKLL